MPEKLGCVSKGDNSGEDLRVEVDVWDAPLGGLLTKGSSSEELSSDAPRMNLSRSLSSGLELSFGTLVLLGFLLAGGSIGSFESTIEEDGGDPELKVLMANPVETLSVRGLSCAEVTGRFATEDKGQTSACEADLLSLAADEPQPDGVSSPFTGIAAVLVVILHSTNKTHMINAKSAKTGIYRHPQATATITK